MDKNLKNFIIKFVVFAILLFVIRAAFQAPVEYYRLKMFYEQGINRVFSKGDAMKVIVLVGILFIVYLKERIGKLAHPKINYKHSIPLLIGSLISVAGVYALRYITNLYSITEGMPLYLIIAAKFAALAVSFILLLLAVFQIPYVEKFYEKFKLELLVTAILLVVFYFLLMFFQSNWMFFSGTVMNFLVAMFSPYYEVTVIGTLLSVDGFAVSIGAPCSGIESLMLFFSLFAVILALDYKRIRITPYIIAFVAGLFGTFVVNNLRIFLLILVGIHVNPKLAVGLFHTHAGWILFIIYFIIYFAIIKKFIYKKELVKGK